jgi:hypothetical protein
MLVIYDFAPDPLLNFLYMRKILFSFFISVDSGHTFQYFQISAEN